MNALDLLDTLALVVWVGWAWGGWIPRGTRFERDWTNWIFFEFRPFVPPAILCDHLWWVYGQGDPFNQVRLSLTAVALFGWWLSRKDHDDRWKRRRDTARALVKDIGHRLVVVPDGAS